ncbi:MAG TPA: hypothetical protein VMD27_08505 [Candidatus Aquilonibacter sp.]|nr:hypothetical protein [Candidatus Aquilonibacter sp.]
MKHHTLADLQESLADKAGFRRLADYQKFCAAYLSLVAKEKPTRIISPSHQHYIFYQYSKKHGHAITRPLNTQLFFESDGDFSRAFVRFVNFLSDLKKHQQAIGDSKGRRQYLESNEINRVIYTLQQSIGCVGDSFANENQSRKRIGQLFESLIKLIIKEIGVTCEPRTINLPIPNFPGQEMSYELDLVFSKNKAIIASETKHIHPSEVVGSVKTTSKDRIDKVFLDKFLLTKLLGRPIPVVAIFLHDVQRAKRGQSIFGINSTFKSNHFLGYTVALNRLDGVYYIDPRPEMISNERLREQIQSFQKFLVQDLWSLARE